MGRRGLACAGLGRPGPPPPPLGARHGRAAAPAPATASAAATTAASPTTAAPLTVRGTARGDRFGPYAGLTSQGATTPDTSRAAEALHQVVRDIHMGGDPVLPSPENGTSA